MAQIPNQIKKVIYTYLTALKKNNIPIKEAILFGSYATGTFHEFSDIDIAIVSSIFKGNRIEDRSAIRAITLSVSSAIEVLPFTPKDFNSKNPFVKEIIKHGIKISQ